MRTTVSGIWNTIGSGKTVIRAGGTPAGYSQARAQQRKRSAVLRRKLASALVNPAATQDEARKSRPHPRLGRAEPVASPAVVRTAPCSVCQASSCMPRNSRCVHVERLFRPARVFVGRSGIRHDDRGSAAWRGRAFAACLAAAVATSGGAVPLQRQAPRAPQGQASRGLPIRFSDRRTAVAGYDALRERSGGGAARSDDPRREDRPDDPGREERIDPPTSAAFSLGSILSGGGGFPNPTPHRPGTTWSTPTSRPRSGPVWASRSSTASTRFTATTMWPARPSFRRTSAWVPRTIRRSSQQACAATALEMNATGIRWDFGPVVAVPQDVRWGRTFEGYGEDTRPCLPLGAACIGGLQGSDLGAADTSAATAKHFIGDGGTAFGTLHRERPDGPVSARPGRRPDGRGHAAQAIPAAVPGRHRGRRPDRDGLLLRARARARCTATAT